MALWVKDRVCDSDVVVKRWAGDAARAACSSAGRNGAGVASRMARPCEDMFACTWVNQGTVPEKRVTSQSGAIAGWWRRNFFLRDPGRQECRHTSLPSGGLEPTPLSTVYKYAITDASLLGPFFHCECATFQIFFARSTLSTPRPITHPRMRTMSTSMSPKLRALYRSFLRELPPRPILARTQSPLHQRLREYFHPETTLPASTGENAIAQAEQYLAYVRAQRTYVTLVERYNPGMGMDEEERVRLTARRVGMDLPVEYGAKK